MSRQLHLSQSNEHHIGLMDIRDEVETSALVVNSKMTGVVAPETVVANSWTTRLVLPYTIRWVSYREKDGDNNIKDRLQPTLHLQDETELQVKYKDSMIEEIRGRNAPPDIIWRFMENGVMSIDFNNKRSWNVTTWNTTISTDVNNPDRDSHYNLSTTTTSIKQLDGHFIGFFCKYFDIFSHVVVDHLSPIAWIRKHILSQPKNMNVKLLLMDTYPMRDLLEWLDAPFARERVIWLTAAPQHILINGSISFITSHIGAFRYPCYFQSLREWARETKVATTSVEHDNGINKTIIYVTRDSKSAKHHRVIESSHEANMLQIIKNAMHRHGKVEEFIVYGGTKTDWTGKVMPMTFKEQYNLFHSAQTVIGAHGGAFANIIWMGDFLEHSGNYEDHDEGYYKPQVLEFMIGPDSNQVQFEKKEKDKSNINFRKTYFFLYGSAPWIEYHHILYASNSTKYTTYINLTVFERALDFMWD